MEFLKQLIKKKQHYEIHITSNEKIIDYLKSHGLRYLEIDMLSKEYDFIKRDYMTAIKLSSYDFNSVMDYTSNLAYKIQLSGIPIYRIKIECEPLDEYLDKALYVESHSEVSDNFRDYPLSYLINKGKYVSTKREYNKNKYREFIENNKKSEICLIDNYQSWDKEWFDLWN